MQTSRIPENQKPHADRDLVQMYGKANPETLENQEAQTPYSDREVIEATIDALALNNAGITKTVRALNGSKRGSYFVTITNNVEWNEIQVRLYDTPRGRPIATGFIDKGHTTAAKYEAAQELRGLVRAYLCR